MEVKCYAGLAALPEAYGALLKAAEVESFFNGSLWYRALLATTTGPEDEQCFYGLEDEASGRPLGLLPALSSPHRRGPLGARLLNGCHSVYSMAFSPLLSPDLQDAGAAVDALVGALAADCPRWDVVSLRLLDRDSALFTRLLAAFDHSGFTPEPYFQFGNWYEAIAGRSFAQYLAGRGKSVRKTVARAVRHFDDRSEGHYEICSGRDGLEQAIADFKKVYGASWKSNEQHPAFIERLMSDCAAAGSLRLANLYLDGRPVATWFVVVAHGTAFLMKTAYDGDVPANLSVGGVLTFKVVQHLIDVDGVQVIDFGIGDEDYKSKWMSSRRERWGIMAYNRHTAKGRVLGAMVQGRTWMRGTLRRSAAE